MVVNNMYTRVKRNAFTSIFFIVLGIIISLIAVLCFSNGTEGFEQTEGVIYKITSTRVAGGVDEPDSYDYEVLVKYTVGDTDYTEVWPEYQSSYKVGKIIKIYYNPENPAELRSDSSTIGIIAAIVGGGALLFGFITFFIGFKRSKKATELNKEFKKANIDISNISFSKTYHYSVDFKNQHRFKMCDENNMEAYCANCLSTNFFKGYTYEFSNNCTYVKVIHTASRTSNEYIRNANNSTFKFDGIDVFDYIHNAGIFIQSDIQDERGNFIYTVIKNNTPIAFIHTENNPELIDSRYSDYFKGAAIRGFYKIQTEEEYIDDAFLIAFIMTRTNLFIYE